MAPRAGLGGRAPAVGIRADVFVRMMSTYRASDCFLKVTRSHLKLKPDVNLVIKTEMQKWAHMSHHTITSTERTYERALDAVLYDLYVARLYIVPTMTLYIRNSNLSAAPTNGCFYSY